MSVPAADRAAFIDSVMHRLLFESIFALVAIGVVAIVVGYVVAGRALAPLQRVTATARRLSESTLHQRIALEGPEDEIKELADTFDAMLERLARAFDSQRRFVANASHELRTPLTINRTLLEVALADPQASEDLKVVGRTLLATNARHQRLIDGLLLLARSERGLDSADLAWTSATWRIPRSPPSVPRSPPPGSPWTRNWRRPRPRANLCCSSISCTTCSTTRSSTTATAARYGCARGATTAVHSCTWPTPGRLSRRTTSRACSSRSAA